jgi:hypothetical protein
MKTRTITVGLLGGTLLLGCASILGIEDLPSDGGVGDGGGSSGSSSSGSGGTVDSSGGSSGNAGGSSGNGGGISGGSSGNASSSGATADGSGTCVLDPVLTCTGGAVGYSCSGAAEPTESQPTLLCSNGVAGAGGATVFCCTTLDTGSVVGDSGGSCTPPVGAACQIDPACGCPSGQKCSYTSTCVAAGTAGSGSLCSLETDCAAGVTCAASVCKPYCNAPGVTCPAAAGGPPLGLCVQIENENGTPILQDSYCLLDCTLSPNSCGAGQTCDIVTINGSRYGNCVAAGTAAAGETCTSTTDCVAGTVCFNTGSGFVCAQPCRTAADCASLTGTSCDTNMGGLVGGVEYGVCFR